MLNHHWCSFHFVKIKAYVMRSCYGSWTLQFNLDDDGITAEKMVVQLCYFGAPSSTSAFVKHEGAFCHT
jgi:hypothetical protein